MAPVASRWSPASVVEVRRDTQRRLGCLGLETIRGEDAMRGIGLLQGIAAPALSLSWLTPRPPALHDRTAFLMWCVPWPFAAWPSLPTTRLTTSRTRTTGTVSRSPLSARASGGLARGCANAAYRAALHVAVFLAATCRVYCCRASRWPWCLSARSPLRSPPPWCCASHSPSSSPASSPFATGPHAPPPSPPAQPPSLSPHAPSLPGVSFHP